MRRRRIPGWESEAREATERIRRVLNALAQLEKEVAAGTISVDQFGRALDEVWEETDWAIRWFPIWRQRALSEGAADMISFAVFSRTMSRFLLKFSGGHSVFRLLPDRTLRV